jgi:acetylornithine/LysW-gamma-L-lysine aminotransferase
LSAIEIEDRYLVPVYQKFRVQIERGKGAYVWDSSGSKYIDLMGGYGVALVGHCNSRVVEAVIRQAGVLLTCHGSFYNRSRAEYVERLLSHAPSNKLTRVHLSNSGAESVEAALKFARKFTGRTKIVATTGSFHGKTFGALSATWNPKYRKAFEPLIPSVEFIPFGNAEKAIETIDKDTAAFIVEPVQGESGIHVSPNGYLKRVREACSSTGTILIFDEIQCGFGRTGKLWACQHWNVSPDLMCLAKGLAGGVPIGATLVTEEIASSLKVGDHSSTFGGNPLACAAAKASLEALIEDNLIENARTVGEHFRQSLESLSSISSCIREVRGLGLMLALELKTSIKEILERAIYRKILPLYSGINILRFLPPLVLTKDDVDIAVKVLTEILESKQSLPPPSAVPQEQTMDNLGTGTKVLTAG